VFVIRRIPKRRERQIGMSVGNDLDGFRGTEGVLARVRDVEESLNGKISIIFIT